MGQITILVNYKAKHETREIFVFKKSSVCCKIENVKNKIQLVKLNNIDNIIMFHVKHYNIINITILLYRKMLVK